MVRFRQLKSKMRQVFLVAHDCNGYVLHTYNPDLQWPDICGIYPDFHFTCCTIDSSDLKIRLYSSGYGLTGWSECKTENIKQWKKNWEYICIVLFIQASSDKYPTIQETRPSLLVRRDSERRTTFFGWVCFPPCPFFSFRLILLFNLILFNLPKFIDAIINNTCCACHQ